MKEMRKRITRFVTLSMCILTLGNAVTVSAATKQSDYWTNKETAQLHYSGYIQFVPAYTTSKSSYGVPKNKHVKQAYINYSRNGKSVIGGRKYTSIATKKTSGTTYYAKASCWDSLNPFAAKTKFNYDWITF